MFQLLQLNNVPILEQLQLEEALLRASDQNWCILNTNSTPAIVMGISGKPERLLDVKKVADDQIPLIKRFSGGGTVYIDSQTVFVTFICNSAQFPVLAQPKAILEWSETIYQPIFKGFSVRENDYVFGEKKFGGNALYIQKERWLLHTSFLWDYTAEKMNYLLLPEKRPCYRGERSHTDFLCTLKHLFPVKEQLLETLTSHLQSTFQIQISSQEAAKPFLEKPHRRSTCFLECGDISPH